MPHVFQSHWVVSDAFHVQRFGAVVVGDEGRIQAVLGEHSSAAERAQIEGLPTTDFGNSVLLPGLVNAHAHLELSDLEVEPGGSFGEWVGRVLAARAARKPSDYRAAVELGARRLLETGTTTVGDLDSSGASEARLPDLPLRACIHRELLDGDDASRTAAQLARLQQPWPSGPRITAGVAPHAPHTVSDALLEQCVASAHVHGLPLSIHWAETEAECEWLAHGSGPFSAFLRESPRCSGLQRLKRAGALGTSLSLVHGNHPEAQDLADLAAAGSTLVHCPGTHAYFGRSRAPLAEWAASGVAVALGTDSLASNADLDMRREMSLVRREHPELEAAVVLEWATRGGARALGMGDQIGDLAVGKWADFAVLEAGGMENSRDVVEGVTASCPAVRGVWVAGRQV